MIALENNNNIGGEVVDCVITPIVGVDWVSVEEQLPEYEERVLIYTTDSHIFDSNKNFIRIYIGRLYEGRTTEEVLKTTVRRMGDQIDGNQKPYYWKEGARYLHGQNVTHWKLMLPPFV